MRPIGAPLAPLPPEAATADITHFTFIAYGDSRGRHDGQALQYEHGLVVQSMLKRIASIGSAHDSVRFVVWSGDATVDGRIPAQWNVSFDPLVERITGAGVPFFPAPGNHDVAHTDTRDSRDREQALKNYYSAFEYLIPPAGAPRRLAGYPTYAFGYGNSFLIGWDSNIASDSTQFAWIRAQLEGLDRTRYPNVFVFQHHPAFSSGRHGGPHADEQTLVIRTRYMPLFLKHHVRLILAGHEHLFEHWVERYQDGAGKSYRLDQIVSGGGGAPIYTYTSEPDLSDYLKSGSALKGSLEHLVRPGTTESSNPYHFVIVHVDGTDIRIEVVGAEHDFHPYGVSTMDLGPTVTNR
ncbi:MAG: metallophosphoesterase [Gemmatimonadaceae bacterium]